MEEDKFSDKSERPEVDIEADIPLPIGIAGALAYFIPVFGGVFFLFAERRNRFLRFHCVQSILFWVFFGLCFALSVILGSYILRKLVWIALFISWGIIIYKAINRESYKLPVIGDIAHGQIDSERR